MLSVNALFFFSNKIWNCTLAQSSSARKSANSFFLFQWWAFCVLLTVSLLASDSPNKRCPGGGSPVRCGAPVSPDSTFQCGFLGMPGRTRTEQLPLLVMDRIGRDAWCAGIADRCHSDTADGQRLVLSSVPSSVTFSGARSQANPGPPLIGGGGWI